MAIEIIKAGMLSTVQDRGRYGYQQYGVNVSGVMDENAARVANILVGNDENAAVLEITMAGAIFTFTEDYLISICGGNMSPYIQNESVPMWQPFIVKKGSTLSFAKYVSGCRAYIAVSGGISVPEVMGSSSTFIRASLGGYKGRALQSGDIVTIQPLSKGSLSSSLMSKLTENQISLFNAQHFAIELENHLIVRYVPGPEFDLLTEESKRSWNTERWRIDAQSDRMGYRLQGAQLEMVEKHEMISEGTVHGTIQLPVNGQPIVLLSDRQTTGGYPRIACVVAVDIAMFGQLKPGDYISFIPVSHEEAEQLLLSYEYDMELLKASIKLKCR